MIVALSLITDKKNALPIELIGKVSAVYCLITSGRNGKKCLLIEKRLSPSVERRTKTKKLTGDNPQNYKEMKLKDKLIYVRDNHEDLLEDVFTESICERLRKWEKRIPMA